jgi:HEAT repeat protein
MQGVSAREAHGAVAPLVEEAFRALSKAFRAWQLYLPNNPMRERALDAARSSFAACWADDAAPVRVTVREGEFVYEGQVVHRELDRPTDGIPWTFYRDGVRELTLHPGFESEALTPLLQILQRARQAAPDDDDLVTMLWVADLETLHYRFVDVGGAVDAAALTANRSAGGAFDAGGHGDRPGIGLAAAESPLLGDGPPGVLRMEDFDSTLYFLDARELAYLQEEVRSEFGEDPRRSVLATLFDMIELRREDEVRAEAIEHIESTMVDLLAGGAYELAAYALREARVTASRSEALPTVLQERLVALADRLSEPAVVAQLLQAVDEGSRAPGAETLEALVAELRGSALATLLAWLAQSPMGAARGAVERAVMRLAEQHTGELVRLIEGPDAAVALGAIRLSAQLRSPAAVPGLARVLRGGDTVARIDAVLALSAIGSPGALQALEPMLDDAEREVRVSAMRAVGTHRYQAALPRLSRALARKELRNAERAEKTALFDAFGTICGDAGVPALDGLLNGRSLLGPRESTEMRACAARALGLVATRQAADALRKSVDAKDAVVRNEVARALRGGAA